MAVGRSAQGRTARLEGPPGEAAGVSRAPGNARGTTMTQSLLSRLAAATAAISFALAAAGPAAAHSRPETTAPADGEVVGAAPAVIAISFDKPMRVTTIELTNADGEAFALERTDGMAPVTRFEATPPVLPDGSYTVEWRGLSQDGHAMSGRFSFEVRP